MESLIVEFTNKYIYSYLRSGWLETKDNLLKRGVVEKR